MPVPHLGWLHLMGLSPYADGWPWQMLVRHEGTATHPKGLAYFVYVVRQDQEIQGASL